MEHGVDDMYSTSTTFYILGRDVIVGGEIRFSCEVSLSMIDDVCHFFSRSYWLID